MNANFTSSHFFSVQSVAWCPSFQEETMLRVPQTGCCWCCCIAMTATIMHLSCGNMSGKSAEGFAVCQLFSLRQVLDSSKDISPAAPLACDGSDASRQRRPTWSDMWHICDTVTDAMLQLAYLNHCDTTLRHLATCDVSSCYVSSCLVAFSINTCGSSWHILGPRRLL